MSAIDDTAKLRVCLIAPGEVFGGAERQILALAKHLHPQCDLTVCLFHRRDLYARIAHLPCSVLVLKPGMRGLRQLRTLFIAERIQVAHLHGYRASIEASLASLGLGIPLVKTVHGAPEFDQASRRARAMIRMYYALERSLELIVKPHLVYVTRELSERQGLSVPEARSSVIYNGLDLGERSKFAREFPRRSPMRRVLVLGRLDRVKGVDLAIQAIAAISDPTICLDVVGEGPERCRLEALADTLGVRRRVNFLGFQVDVHRFLSAADVLLIPSRHEGLPYTLLEAMSAFLPVVASNVGGMKEVLTSGQSALLVEPSDSVAMAESIAMILNDAELKARLTLNAHHILTTRFDARGMANQYLRLYGCLVLERAARYE